MSERIADRELALLASAAIGLELGLVGDDLDPPPQIARALESCYRLFDEVAGRKGDQNVEASRRLLVPFMLAAGEILRLWHPLARDEGNAGKGGERRQQAQGKIGKLWQRMEAVAQSLRDNQPDAAARALRELTPDLAALPRHAIVIDESTTIAEALAAHSRTHALIMELAPRCLGCVVASQHRIKDAALCHPFDATVLLSRLRQLEF